MLTISAEAHALIAQIIAVLVFASVVELRKAFNAQLTYELKALVGICFVAGFLLSGGILVSRIVDAAEGGTAIETTVTMFEWVCFQFLTPVMTLVVAQLMKLAGQVLSGKKAPDTTKMSWLFRELLELRRNESLDHDCFAASAASR